MTEAAMRRSIGADNNKALRTPHADAQGGDVPDGECRRSTDWDAVDEARLPTMLRRLIRSMGLPATLHLLQARGGTRFYLGGRRGRRDRTLLRDLIGAIAAEAFYGEFTGTPEVTLPKADKILAQLRDAAICADQDHSLSELAVMYRLTSRQIQNIRARGFTARERAPDRQFDLFSGLGPLLDRDEPVRRPL